MLDYLSYKSFKFLEVVFHSMLAKTETTGFLRVKKSVQNLVLCFGKLSAVLESMQFLHNGLKTCKTTSVVLYG